MSPFDQSRLLATPETRDSIELIESFFEKLDAFPMGVDPVVGDARRVTTRRTEERHFSTGEVLELPDLRLHEIENGQIKRWHELSNMPAFLAQLPKSWLEGRTQ